MASALAHPIPFALARLILSALAHRIPFALARLIAQDLLPLLAAYALFIVVLAAGARLAPPERGSRVDPPPWGKLAARLLTTAAAGYGLFLLIVWVFYVLLPGGGARFPRTAAAGGAVLAFAVAVPAFLALTWIEGALRGRLRGRLRGKKG